MTFHSIPELVDRATRILQQNNSASAIARGCGEIPEPLTTPDAVMVAGIADEIVRIPAMFPRNRDVQK